MPISELVQYLAEQLKIPVQGNQPQQSNSLTESPVSLLYSVFVMALKSIQLIPSLKITTGPVHAGTKIDETGEPDFKSTDATALTYDQICGIMFRTSFWISKNDQGFFSD